MAGTHYMKALRWVERNRFMLLLLSTILTLVLPAFSGNGLLSGILFVVALSFLFIQSMVVAHVSKSRKRVLRFMVLTMILMAMLEPAGIESLYIVVTKMIFFASYFIFVIAHLIRFINRSARVDTNVLITSINIYLLAGIIGACIALLFNSLYPEAYNFPAYIQKPGFVSFLYYSFITLSTVGYGDITPRIPETQTLAYFISVTGQLYVAIIIAFLIGKFLMQKNQEKSEQ